MGSINWKSRKMAPILIHFYQKSFLLQLSLGWIDKFLQKTPFNYFCQRHLTKILCEGKSFFFWRFSLDCGRNEPNVWSFCSKAASKDRKASAEAVSGSFSVFKVFPKGKKKQSTAKNLTKCSLTIQSHSFCKQNTPNWNKLQLFDFQIEAFF